MLQVANAVDFRDAVFLEDKLLKEGALLEACDGGDVVVAEGQRPQIDEGRQAVKLSDVEVVQNKLFNPTLPPGLSRPALAFAAPPDERPSRALKGE